MLVLFRQFFTSAFYLVLIFKQFIFYLGGKNSYSFASQCSFLQFIHCCAQREALYCFYLLHDACKWSFVSWDPCPHLWTLASVQTKILICSKAMFIFIYLFISIGGLNSKKARRNFKRHTELKSGHRRIQKSTEKNLLSDTQCQCCIVGLWIFKCNKQTDNYPII